MSSLAPIRGRLEKLVPLLASDKPGEVSATVSAITRALATINADWHDVARELGSEPKPVVVYRERPDPPPTTNDQAGWSDLARWCARNDRGRLTERERKFVGDVVYPIAAYGKPSPKQAAWLHAIRNKLRGGP